MSILAILAASACTFFVIACFVNIKKFDFNTEHDAGAFGSLFVLFLFCMGITSYWGASMHGWAVQLAGMATFTTVACGYMWTYTNWTWGHHARMKEIVGAPRKFINGIWQNIAKNDAFVRRYAQKRVSQLCSLMPGVEWSDMRDQIASVGITALASLLARRKLLKANISATASIIKKYEGNLSSDVMHQLHANTVADLETFQQELTKTETQIGDVVGFLDEVESDVRMALISDDGHAELDKRLLQFAASIQSVKADERAVQQELRSFLDRVSEPLDVPLESTSQTHSQRAFE